MAHTDTDTAPQAAAAQRITTDPKQVVSCAFHHLYCLPLEQLEQSLPIALVNCLQKSQRVLGPIGLSTQRTNESGGVVSGKKSA